MANAEQLSLLKQGVQVWNGWRAKNIYVYADFSGADLNGVDLSKADLRISHFRRANLFRADLSGADLSGADLSDADLREANLSEANLTKANLNGASLGRAFARAANLSQANLLAANLRNANFSHAHLGEANLMVANLGGADLSGADLSKANLTKAHLFEASLRRADLSSARLTGANLTKSDLRGARFIETDLIVANFSDATLGNTAFANSDLSRANGLESLNHCGPSSISINTFILSKAKIPEVFLRGCGLSDADIQYAKLSNPDLGVEDINKILDAIQELRAAQALQISPLFISYSHSDRVFVDKVEGKLNERGIRFWHEDHEMKAGPVEKQINPVIRQNPKVLLILSKHSVKGDWVEQEINEARKLEKEIGRDVLSPVSLDDTWKDSHLPKRIREQMIDNNILDFSGWRDESKFNEMFHTLIEGLELFPEG